MKGSDIVLTRGQDIVSLFPCPTTTTIHWETPILLSKMDVHHGQICKIWPPPTAISYKKSIVTEQIIDNQQIDFASASPRSLELKTLNGVISIVMGVRRCGKSTLMETIMASLVAKGVSRENIVWLNFSDDRFLPLHQGGWDTIHSIPAPEFLADLPFNRK